MRMSAGAFAVSEYDQDDREADKIWEEIDEHMDQRRRKEREKRLKEDLEQMRKRNPKITETFADLKRGLAELMRPEDWEVCCCLTGFAARLGDLNCRSAVSQYIFQAL